MKRQRNVFYGCFACIAMLVIIINKNRALNSVRDGIALCLQTVIPSLFPFFVLSGIINCCFLGQHFRFLSPLRRLCRIPFGTESILLIGLTAGYPVGAQLIADAYVSGNISRENARRMLGFCSNGGPAFIFGMLATAFTNSITPWVLWGIHIVSALTVGWLLPGNTSDKCLLNKNQNLSVNNFLQIAVKNIAMVCGWVILFRMLLDFCNRCFLRLFPTEIQILFSGTLELTNGCVLLQHMESEGMRFILASAMLAFGGLCVAMQTLSVTTGLGIGLYFPGKILQLLISITLSIMIQPLLFAGNVDLVLSKTVLTLLAAVTILFVFLLRKKL